MLNLSISLMLKKRVFNDASAELSTRQIGQKKREPVRVPFNFSDKDKFKLSFFDNNHFVLIVPSNANFNGYGFRTRYETVTHFPSEGCLSLL